MLGTDGKTGEPVCSYCFMCNSTRLFLLHYFDNDSVIADLGGVTKKTHLYVRYGTDHCSRN